MADKKLTEVDTSTSLADSDKLIGNIGNSVKQITLTNLVNIIKNKIGSLKNPHALTFTGAVNDIYDGSAAKTINIPTSSGGGSGTTNYTNLTNKPQINGVELSGNKTLDDLNIQPKGNYLTEVPSEYVTETELNNKGYATTTQLGNKLDKNQSASNSGKYLSVGSDGNITLVDAPTGGGTEGDVIDVDAEMKDYMQTVKPAIKSAIINKGGTVQDTDSFGDYATRISQIPNDISPAQTLPEQTTLVAESNSTGITLKWTDVDADGYLIVRKLNATPQTAADGTIVYNSVHSSTGYLDDEVSYGNTYHYRIFPRNSVNQYQAIEDGSVAIVNHIDRSDQTSVGSLELGDKIKFGQFGSSLLTWTIIDTLDKSKGYVTVACDQYAVNGPFDASENNSDNPNPTTDRKNNGNNRWAYSNARQFLNSDGEANSWFVAQHTYDMRPNYYNQAGFLNAFTTYEKNIIVAKTNINDLATVDGGGSETTPDKIWLPSYYAMGLGIQQPLEDDHIYEAYVDDESRSFSSNYWLRTINGASSAHQVRIVLSSGSSGSSSASLNVALRPFCLIPTSAYTQWSASDNAYYFADDSQRNSD